MDEGSLGVHELELVVQLGEHLSDGGKVGDHADGSHALNEITLGHNNERLVVHTDLEANGAPVKELDSSFGLDGGNGSVHILGEEVNSVKYGTCHEFTVARVELDHHGGGFETRLGDISYRELFMVGSLGGHDGESREENEVDTGVGDQGGQELGHIHDQDTINS